MRARTAGLFGSALVLAAALVIVFATGGNAAGNRICPVKGPSCITTAILQNYAAVGSQGLAKATFTNQSNSSTNHTTVAVNLPAGTHATAISSVPSADCSTATVSCNFGHLAGPSTVKVFAIFAADSAAGGVTITSTVSF